MAKPQCLDSLNSAGPVLIVWPAFNQEISSASNRLPSFTVS